MLRWLASPTFSKNMKSCNETTNVSEWKTVPLTGFEPKNAEPHDQEAGPQQDGLHLHVHVQRELDTEVVGVGEDLLQEAAPLLTDASDGLVGVFALQLQGNKIMEPPG